MTLQAAQPAALSAFSLAELVIARESPGDLDAIAALHRAAFGPGRFARTAFRLREQADPDPELCFTAHWQGRLVGAILFTPLTIGGEPGAVLLGPLAVTPDLEGRGIGLALMLAGLKAAEAKGVRGALLVGDLPYYGRAGFGPTQPGRFDMPGPVNPARLLARDLASPGLAGMAGPIRGAD